MTISDDAQRLLRKQGKLVTHQETVSTRELLRRATQRLEPQGAVPTPPERASQQFEAASAPPHPALIRSQALITRASAAGIALERCARFTHKCQTSGCKANAAWSITPGPSYTQPGAGSRFACNGHYQAAVERLTQGKRIDPLTRAAARTASPTDKTLTMESLLHMPEVEALTRLAFENGFAAGKKRQ